MLILLGVPLPGSATCLFFVLAKLSCSQEVSKSADLPQMVIVFMLKIVKGIEFSMQKELMQFCMAPV